MALGLRYHAGAPIRNFYVFLNGWFTCPQAQDSRSNSTRICFPCSAETNKRCFSWNNSHWVGLFRKTNRLLSKTPFFRFTGFPSRSNAPTKLGYCSWRPWIINNLISRVAFPNETTINRPFHVVYDVVLLQKLRSREKHRRDETYWQLRTAPTSNIIDTRTFFYLLHLLTPIKIDHVLPLV